MKLTRIAALACALGALGWYGTTHLRASVWNEAVVACSQPEHAPEAAIKACSDLLARLEPGHADVALALRNRGEGRADTQDYEGALEDFESAIKMSPDSHMLWAWKAHALHKLGHLELALDAIETALKIKPTLTYGHRKKFKLLQEMGKTPEAQDFLMSLAPKHPENASVQRNLGTLFESAENHLDASFAYRIALTIDPTDAQSRKGFYTACVTLGDACPDLFPESRSARASPQCSTTGDETVVDSVRVTAAYVGAAMQFLSEGNAASAKELITQTHALDCLKAVPPAWEGLPPEMITEMTRLYGPQTRANLLDLAQVLAADR